MAVRDIYDGGNYLVLVTTDRQSAFDRVLASIPYKGQVLNETSLWWFSKTHHIIPNAVVSSPDRNVTIAKKCSVFPVEFVVRGYVTGSTDTSLWTVYQKGVRNYCGNALPDGMVKNQKLHANILTPTTKAEDHDVPITPEEIVKSGLMTQDDYDEASKAALSLFEFGQVLNETSLWWFSKTHHIIPNAVVSSPDRNVTIAKKCSVFPVEFVVRGYVTGSTDTSLWTVYQKGVRNYCGNALPDGMVKNQKLHANILTPTTKAEDHDVPITPEEIVKSGLMTQDDYDEANHCNPYEDEVLPDAPEELVSELAWRYILLYETITKSKFEIPLTKEPIHDRISRNLSHALSTLP
ncbi:Phosphoribosylaminoimidazole-succinocarboxamide synthase- chloroplastic [Striga hermonthica]|uniref:phosphoribosylaminoimidazolesuccinocarboxamide synthase n=1 Tax=Striga hermonthica TaxID=68872 RepID=A0A9N7N9G1_STRHE|nr:Phosphoribosylaminoimidazole-succinocarboxamide synthase- chloroplastic [Striga hermonthica]